MTERLPATPALPFPPPIRQANTSHFHGGRCRPSNKRGCIASVACKFDFPVSSIPVSICCAKKKPHPTSNHQRYRGQRTTTVSTISTAHVQLEEADHFARDYQRSSKLPTRLRHNTSTALERPPIRPRAPTLNPHHQDAAQHRHLPDHHHPLHRTRTDRRRHLVATERLQPRTRSSVLHQRRRGLESWRDTHR